MNAPQNLDELDDVDLAALSTRVLHDMVAKMTPEERQRYRDALDAADAADAPIRDLLGVALGVLDPSSTAPGKKCATCRGAFSGMSWDTLCPSCWEEKLRKEREAKTAPKFQWPTTASKLKRVAAELVRAAEMMGGADDDGEEADLVLSVAPTGWISLTEDRTGGRNEHPILTVHLAEYPEEGSYPVDPLDPTAGRPDESAAPAAGDARDAARWRWIAPHLRIECGEVFETGTKHYALVHLHEDQIDLPPSPHYPSVAAGVDAAIAAQQGKGGEA